METTDTTPPEPVPGGAGPGPYAPTPDSPLPPPAFVYHTPGSGTPPPGPAAGLDEDTFEDVSAPRSGRVAAPRVATPTPRARTATAAPRRRRSLGFWVFLGICAAVLLAVAGFAVWFLRQANPPGAPGEEVGIEIPAGMSRTQLVDALADKGVITSAWAFSIYSKLNTPPDVKAGDYLFHAPSSFGDVYAVLRNPPNKKTFKVTFPEGFTMRQVTERVAAQVPGITTEQFEQAMVAGEVRSRYMPPGVPSYEGYLFPDTYVFEEGTTPDEVLGRMVERFDEVAGEVGIGNVPGMSPHDVVKVASMIEKEAEVDEDRPKIARVIYNRLNARMTLGVDATYLYALAPGTDPNKVNWKTDSPYNTRVRMGLPPTPISNPGRASLEAAAHPADGPWLYYVQTDKEGHHAFTTTLAEHNAATADAKARGVF